MHAHTHIAIDHKSLPLVHDIVLGYMGASYDEVEYIE